MQLTKEKIYQIESFCIEEPDLFLSSFEVETIETVYEDCYLLIKTDDKRSPRIIQAGGINNGGPLKLTPYYLIRERPEAQIASFQIGKGLSNLAEIKELFGNLYSRYSGSYALNDLPHQDAMQSKIASWVHDCLSHDLDHHVSLNRKNLSNGVTISYDFGLSFLQHYYPPFYTFELGIQDSSIHENKKFLLKLLTLYALRTLDEEDQFITRLMNTYPMTCREDLCRYYSRNFKTYFPKRLYYGRFFEKLKPTPFVKEDLLGISEVIGLNMKRINNWKALIEQLSKNRFKKLDLRGLDLSSADLRKADLKGANLRDVNLKGTNLEKVDLRGADLKGAIMDKANLKSALIDQEKFKMFMSN